MITQFKPLLTLTINHAYYQGVCRDFAIGVPSDTATLLRNGKLLAKVVDSQLHVLYEADANGAALKALTGKTLTLGLSLLNGSFVNFTDFPAEFGTLLYRNGNSPTALDAAQAVIPIAATLTHAISKTDRPLTLELKDRDDNVLQTDSLASDDTSITYDLRVRENGLYRVSETANANTITRNYYLHRELINDTFGIVEIVIDANFYTNPRAFSINFDARQETLKYYLVAKNYGDVEFNQIAISDAGFADDGRNEIQFTRVASNNFGVDDIAPTSLGDSGSKVALFKSQQLLPRVYQPRHKIQLSKNGDLLIAQLPQPNANNARADVIIHISKP